VIQKLGFQLRQSPNPIFDSRSVYFFGKKWTLFIESQNQFFKWVCRMFRSILSIFLLFDAMCLCADDSLVAKKVIDLTHTLSEETLVYPGKTPFSRVICANCEAGYSLHDISLNTGIGTHMDAPNHFCFGGGMDSVSLLKLFHTGWDRYWGTERFCEPDEQGVCHFPGISEEAAHFLVKRGVGVVGIDAMGIDVGINREYIAHKILLGARIPLVENLACLRDLPAIGTTVYMLPMKIKDAPEAPIRAMAIID
jgi:kynurenine formamidase